MALALGLGLGGCSGPGAAVPPTVALTPPAAAAPGSGSLADTSGQRASGPAPGASIPLRPFTARRGLLLPSQNPFGPSAAQAFSLVLLEAPASCAEADAAAGAERVRVELFWRVGSRAKVQHVSIVNGEASKLAASIEVLEAPTQPGALGKVRLVEDPDTSVRGGEIAVEICP